MHRSALLLSILALAAGPAGAASFCVSNSAELDAALETARTNADTSDVIRLRPGVYPAPAQGFRHVFAGNDSINISGGWGNLIGNCDLPSYDPTLSVLDGQELNAVLVNLRSGAGTGATEISWLTIRGGRQMMSSLYFGNGGGFASFGSGPVSISHVIFQNNRANMNGGAVYIGGTERTLRNNLFIDNQATSGSAVFGPAGGPVQFSNNSVSRNPYSGSAGAAVDFSQEGTVSAWNNILRANSSVSFPCDFLAHGALLTQNIIGDPCGLPDGASQGNTSVDPQFISASDFRLRPASPAIHAGVNNGVASRDLDGRPRQIGPAVDQGAYETDRGYANGFE